MVRRPKPSSTKCVVDGVVYGLDVMKRRPHLGNPLAKAVAELIELYGLEAVQAQLPPKEPPPKRGRGRPPKVELGDIDELTALVYVVDKWADEYKEQDKRNFLQLAQYDVLLEVMEYRRLKAMPLDQEPDPKDKIVITPEQLKTFAREYRRRKALLKQWQENLRQREQ
jgi:hypothetical protein